MSAARPKPLCRTIAVLGITMLVGTALHAQVLRTKRDLLPSMPVLVKPIPPQEEIVLTDMPHDMVLLGEWAGWPPGRFGTGALPGRRYTMPPMKDCRPSHDYVDLARIRANGFRVTRYALSPAIGPGGYTAINSQFVTSLKTEHGRYLNAHDPAEIDRIDITPQVFVLDVKAGGKTQRLGCTSTWQLSIRVRGPKGIDPYTGARQ